MDLTSAVRELRSYVHGLLTHGLFGGGVFSPHVGGSYGGTDSLRPYGLASTPADGTESVAAIRGDQALVLGELDQTAPSTAKGEVALYDTHGNTITLTSDGITITSKDGAVITLDADLSIEAGGTEVHMTDGKVYLGCASDDPQALQVLVDGTKKAKNVYAAKEP